MDSYKYYLLGDCLGGPYEIYRGEAVPADQFASAGLWRAKKDGSWSGSDKDVTLVCNLMSNGEFDPENDEITEEEALGHLAKWRAPGGHWPGRE
jgi:hypothetical protein